MNKRKTDLACSFVKWLSLIMVFAAPALMTAYWISPVDMPFMSHRTVDFFADPATLTIGQRFAGFLIDLIPIALLSAGLWKINRLAHTLKAGQFFERETIGHLHAAGVLFILFVIANVIDRALISLMLTFQNPPGERQIAIHVEGSDFGFLLFGVLFLILISVFAEGQKQREDLSEIV